MHIQVPVNVCGHLNIGVTHVFLHIFQRKTVVQQETGTAVPKLVKADMRQVVVLQEKREMGGNVIRGKGCAVGPLEDKVVLCSCGSRPMGSILLLLPCSR